MWPKAISQLVELAPHITRLLPLADRYFKDKNSSDDATREALDTHRAFLEAQRSALEAQQAAVSKLGDRLQSDLGAITSRQTTQATQTAALQKQLTELVGQIALPAKQLADLERHLTSTRTDALAAKQATESLEGRLARIESGQRRAQTFAVVALALLTAILILIVTLFLRAR